MSFSFGQTPSQTKGFTFGTPSTGTTATTGAGGFTFGGAATTKAATTAPSLGSLSFGASSAGTTATPTSTLGGLGKATATASTGFSFGKPTATAAPTTGLTLGGLVASTATTTSGLPSFSFGGLKGLGQTTATTASTGLSVAPAFPSTAQPTTKGLGGVDPQTKTSSSANGANNGKTSDSKTIKESNIPNEIAATVDTFKEQVKNQKSVRENISRLSSKPIFKVQEDVQMLRQMISLVSNGLQRNAGAIEKLKAETSQELKNAEVSHRTKDTPPGLQYENTAPIEYFQRLIEDFESRMIQYRQQIENVENHFVTLNQPGIVSLQDLTMLLRKLHETFIAFAAQLQVVHEAVKVQKEHYLNHRKVFQGDSTNVFEAHHKAKAAAAKPTTRLGPTPFSGMTNIAAIAMATALNRGQQPAGAPPTVGLGTMPGAQTSQALTLGTGGLGFGATTTTTASTGFSFGTPATQNTGFSFGTPSTSAFATSSPFQLQKPPAGSKRGKKN